MRNRTISYTVVAIALLGVGCATGSDGKQPVEQPEVKQEAQLAEPSAQPDRGKRHGKNGKHGKQHGKRGADLIGGALEFVDLSDEQRTKIEALRNGLRGDPAARHEAHKEHKAKLIAAIRSGNLADLEIDKAAMEKRMSEKTTKIVSALNELHQTLDASQRETLVDTLRAKHEARSKRRAERKGAKGDGEKMRRHEGKAKGKHMRGGFGRFMKDLDLTEEQRAKLDAARPTDRPSRGEWKAKREARAKKMTETLTAFAKADFDAARLDLGARFSEHMAHGMNRGMKHFETLLPILTPAQRTKLADKMQLRFEQMKDRKLDRPGHGGMLDMQNPADEPPTEEIVEPEALEL